MLTRAATQYCYPDLVDTIGTPKAVCRRRSPTPHAIIGR
jgi:hypothetical protein